MPSKVISCMPFGVDPIMVEVEVDISRGLPSFNIVGLPDASVRESKERVRSAIKNSGFDFPVGRITVNLAPAHIKKEGALFDLPIALGILAEKGIIDKSRLSDAVVCGELSLHGEVKRINGALVVGEGARTFAKSIFVFPRDNLSEIRLLSGLVMYPVSTLVEASEVFVGKVKPLENGMDVDHNINCFPDSYELDFADVAGQLMAKRAAEIAASGFHNILFFGPPGVGKSMIARRIPTILPGMNIEEIIEVTKIYSVAGKLSADGIVGARPFRSPHHTISDVALIGGGNPPKPGEVSLSHKGVLFLDELPEFKRSALETLREVLESHRVSISRASYSLEFPADFMLVCAMNPCPCGYFGHPGKECKCSYNAIRKYASKVSGPFLDRIDIVVEMPPIEEKGYIYAEEERENSHSIRVRVEKCWEIQKRRGVFNSRLTVKEMKEFCKLKAEDELFLKDVAKKLSLSVRSIHKIIKVARTIADIEGSSDIGRKHLLEAIQYRRIEKLESLYS